MRIILISAAMLLGCSASGISPTPSSPVPAVSPAANAPRCDFDGGYRLRYAANGQDGWWFRARVTDDRAELTAPADVLGLAAGPIGLTTDPAKCRLTLTAHGTIGDMRADLALNPRTNTVTGTLTRSAPRDDREKLPVTMAGVRDVGAPQGRACIVPGIYSITNGVEPNWKSTANDRDCGLARFKEIQVRIEHVAEQLVITQVEPEDSNKQRSASEMPKQARPCAADLVLADFTLVMQVKLIFTASKITGLARKVSDQIIEDGEDGENTWECVARRVPLDVVRLDP